MIHSQLHLERSIRRSWTYSLTAVLVGFCLAHSAAASITNGDFETGDLTGWTASAMDGVFLPMSADSYVSAQSAGGNSFSEFRTGAFADGLFVGTLEQSFAINAAEPMLYFHFSSPEITSDATGTGTSPFLDSFFVSLFNGVDTLDLLMVDSIGYLEDPFGTAPGTVTVDPSSNPLFEFTLSADLSSLAGDTVTLYFDIIQEDDGAEMQINGDNVRLATVPEPSGLFLILAGFGFVFRKRFSRESVR